MDSKELQSALGEVRFCLALCLLSLKTASRFRSLNFCLRLAVICFENKIEGKKDCDLKIEYSANNSNHLSHASTCISRFKCKIITAISEKDCKD